MDIKDILYRPDIKEPVRTEEATPDVAENEAERESREELAERLGVAVEDIPGTPLDLMKTVFVGYEEKGRELRRRAVFLLEKAIDNLDGYVGNAPEVLQDYLTLLLDKPTPALVAADVPGRAAGAVDPTDEALTLSDCEKRCIFRIAGYFNPVKEDLELMEAVDSMDKDRVKRHIDKKINTKGYMDVVNKMKRILLIVLKLSYVIAVHHTVGYVCAWFKGKLKIGFRIKIGKKRWGKRFSIGDMIANKILKPTEKALLSIVGYKCGSDEDPPKPCASAPWEKIDFNKIKCCSKSPVFFVKGKNGTVRLEYSRCFQKFIRQELDPDYSGDRVVCSQEHCADDTLEASAEEIESARVVAKYLMENGQRYEVSPRDDIPTLSRAIAHADMAVQMSTSVQSVIDQGKTYQYNGKPGSIWDCFGYYPVDGNTELGYTSSHGDVRPDDLPIIEQGMGIGSMDFLTYLQTLDKAVASALSVADKVVTGVARLSKWGSSKELCCWIYLFVVISSMWWNLRKHGTLCPNQEQATNLREQMRFASRLRAGKGLTTFVTLLKVLKQVIDLFIRKMKRRVFLAGLALPLHDMWEQIKLVIANGLAEMLDILFGPLDLILAGLRGFPELRAMIDNDCFGVGKFLDYLSCLLGDLKFALVNWIMQWFDFTLNDFYLLNDIYLSRARLAFLESLSRLLGNMIKLILGLRDCYDPNTLTNAIVEKQIEDQYNEMRDVTELFRSKEDQEYLDVIASSPVMSGTSLIDDEQTIATLDGSSGSLAGMFADQSGFFRTVVDPFMRDATAPMMAVDRTTLRISEFTDGEGNLVSLSKFTEIMTERTGVSITEMKESMNSVYDIIISALERE